MSTDAALNPRVISDSLSITDSVILEVDLLEAFAREPAVFCADSEISKANNAIRSLVPKRPL